MNNNISIPQNIENQTSYKRKVSLSELFRSLVLAARSAIVFIKNKKQNTIDEQFLERLQLAVTEVNSCAVCSYAHTQMALKMGMNNDEISGFLTGDKSFVKPEESKAILFAQHYAETRGLPEMETYEAIVKEYGKEEARIILAAIQLMLMGNMIGLPMSALRARKKGKPYSDSSLLYEYGMIIAVIFIIPIALVVSFVKWIFVRPNIYFETNKEYVKG